MAEDNKPNPFGNFNTNSPFSINNNNPQNSSSGSFAISNPFGKNNNDKSGENQSGGQSKKPTQKIASPFSFGSSSDKPSIFGASGFNSPFKVGGNVSSQNAKQEEVKKVPFSQIGGIFGQTNLSGKKEEAQKESKDNQSEKSEKIPSVFGQSSSFDNQKNPSLFSESKSFAPKLQPISQKKPDNNSQDKSPKLSSNLDIPKSNSQPLKSSFMSSPFGKKPEGPSIGFGIVNQQPESEKSGKDEVPKKQGGQAQQKPQGTWNINFSKPAENKQEKEVKSKPLESNILGSVNQPNFFNNKQEKNDTKGGSQGFKLGNNFEQKDKQKQVEPPMLKKSGMQNKSEGISFMENNINQQGKSNGGFNLFPNSTPTTPTFENKQFAPNQRNPLQTGTEFSNIPNNFNPEQNQLIPNKTVEMYCSVEQVHNKIIHKNLTNSEQSALIKTVKCLLGFVEKSEQLSIETWNIQHLKVIENQMINKLLNDVSIYVCEKLGITPASYKLIINEFKQMLQQYGIIQKMQREIEQQYDPLISTGFYSIGANRNYKFHENAQSESLLDFFVTHYLISIQKTINLLSIRKFNKQMAMMLLDKLFEMSKKISVSCDPLGKKITDKITNLLSDLFESWLKSFQVQKIITCEQFIMKIPLMEELVYGRAGRICQFMLLSLLQKIENRQKIYSQFSKTRNQIFIPFRKRQGQFTDKISKIVRGPEWIDWMDQYLSQRNDFDTPEIINIIKSIQSFNEKRSNLDLQNKKYIREFIKKIKDHSVQFYTILTQYIEMSDSSAVQTILKEFFAKKQNILKELKPLIQQIKRYPNADLSPDNFMQAKSKVLFYLTIIKKDNEMAFKMENLFFDTHGFMDQISERCDRISHTILDFIGYFSGAQFDEDILITALDCIIALLVNERSKFSMGLAMNINRPSLNFTNCVISQKCADKLAQFLTKMSNTKEFYECVRSPDMAAESSRAYPFRYMIEKYWMLTQKHSTFVPTYWFSEFFNVIIKQDFNPKLMYTILSKLLIIPSEQDFSSDKPFILQRIVSSCNSAKFWHQFIEIFEAENYFSEKNRLILVNKLLAEDKGANKTQSMENIREKVFYSLKMLRVLFELKQITEYAQQVAPTHFVTRLLSSLRWLDEMKSSFISEREEMSLTSRSFITKKYQYVKRTSSIVGLVALISHQSPMKNNQIQFSNYMVWEHVNIPRFNYAKARQQLEQNQHEIDYRIINDILTPPNNKYLQNDDRIASLVFECLSYIIEQSNQISLESILYSLIQNEYSTTNSLLEWNRTIIQNIGNALLSTNANLRVQASKFLVTLKKSKENKSFANSIFSQFIDRASFSFNDSSINRYISEFYAISIRENDLIDIKISPLIEALYNPSNLFWNASEIEKKLIYYQETVFPVQYSLHQLERTQEQKEITKILDYLQTIKNLMEIILRMFYKRNRQFEENLRYLIIYVSKAKLLQIIKVLFQEEPESMNLQTLEQLETAIDIEIKQPKPKLSLDLALRCCGKNALCQYLVQKNMTRQTALQIQKINVLKCVQKEFSQFSRQINQFLAIFLSFDKTFYANHPISISQNNILFREMFCQLHLGYQSISCDNMFGENIQNSIETVKQLLNSCLVKIKKIQASKSQMDLSNNFMLIDLLLNWLNSAEKKISKEAASRIIKIEDDISKIIKECFTWFGQPILHPIPAKLLLSLVNIGSHCIQDTQRSLIRQTVHSTLLSDDVLSPDVKQFLLPIFITFPPDQLETEVVRIMVKMWMEEQNHEYFYNLSRVILELSKHHPIEICKTKILTDCSRIKNIVSSHSSYYSNGLRTTQNVSWVWILKIATTLLEQLDTKFNSIIIYQINQFYKNCKALIIRVLSEYRDQYFSKTAQSSTTIQTKSKIISLQIYLAQLDQLQATLQFVFSLFRCNIWITLNRQNFQELFYILINKTIFMFSSSIDNKIGANARKIYKPISDVEKLLWVMQIIEKEDVNGNQGGMEEELLQRQQENQYTPKSFLLLMSIRFMDCAKAWISACSTGMRRSHYIKDYFKELVPKVQQNGKTSLKYSLTHWDHVNQILISILQQDILRIKNWNRLEHLDSSLKLIADCFRSAEVFTEMGYLNTIKWMPENREQLMESLSINISLCLQLCACHLSSQVQFKKKNGTLIFGNFKNFRKKIQKLASQACTLLGKQVARENIKAGQKILDLVSL